MSVTQGSEALMRLKELVLKDVQINVLPEKLDQVIDDFLRCLVLLSNEKR